MALSIEQLTNPINADQARDVIVEVLQSIGIADPLSWQSGSVPRTFLQLAAELYSDISELNAALARARFNSLSTGEWLKLLAIDFYDNRPNEARTTQGTMRLTAAATAPGPFTLNAGDVVVQHGPTGYTYRSINALPVTLAAGAYVDIAFEAEVAGANRNVQSGTITVIIKGPTGVTVSNPVIVGEATWITQLGANAETDEELRERNRTKWATLGYGAPGEAYVHWARSADAAVKRVAVDDQNPRGAGTTDVIIAGDLGGLPSLLVPVKDYLTGVTDGVGRAPVEARRYLEVFSADELPVTESGVVYLSAAYKNSPSKVEEIEKSLTAFYSAIPIGGRKLTAAAPGRILIGDKLKSVTKIAGVINFAPLQNTDQVLTARQVPALTLSLNYQYLL